MKKTLKFFGYVAFFVMSFPALGEPAFSQNNEKKYMTVDKWDSHYYGRFKLALPANSKISADYKIYNENVELIGKKSKPEFGTIIDKKTEDLKKGISYGTSSGYEKTISLNNGSILLLSKVKNLYTFHVYLLTSENTLYLMMARAISVKGLERAIEKARFLSDNIFYRKPENAPPPGSFALEAGYTTLDPTQALEGIYMGAQISTHPGTFVSLLTQQTAEHEESLINRFESNKVRYVGEEMAELISKTEVLRKRERMIGSIRAEELAVAATIGGKRFYTFQIEHQGTLGSNTRPFIDFQLGTHEIGSDFKSDEEALEFWDKVVDSLKPLP